MWLCIQLHLPAKAYQVMIQQHWMGCPWHTTWSENIHHYCYVKEVYVATGHKPAVAVINKDVATQSQQLQCSMLHIHQYSVCISYKPGADLYTADWLSQNNHVENKDQEITGMNANLHAIRSAVDIPISTSIEDIKAETSQDADMQRLQSYILQGWPHTIDEAEHSIQNYWQIRHEEVMIDGIVMKGKWIIMPFVLQNQIPEQLHGSNMGIEKMRILVRESVYWVNMNTDIRITVRQCTTCLEYQ